MFVVQSTAFPANDNFMELLFWIDALKRASAASVTAVNRFIDYWLQIGLGLIVWALRHRIGLRSWREVPLEARHVTRKGTRIEDQGSRDKNKIKGHRLKDVDHVASVSKA